MTLAIPGETHLNAGSRAVAVYCGSSMGRQKAYALAAECEQEISLSKLYHHATHCMT